MYTTKPHFYAGINHNLLKIGVQFPEKLLPALRIRERKIYFCCIFAAHNTPNPEKSGRINYESEV